VSFFLVLIIQILKLQNLGLVHDRHLYDTAFQLHLFKLCLSTYLWHQDVPKNSVTLYVAANLLAFNMVIRVNAEVIFSVKFVFRVFHLLLHLWLFCNTRTLSYFCAHFLAVSIDVSKSQISTVAISGWKPAEGMNVRLLSVTFISQLVHSIITVAEVKFYVI
jgi:hypothetical protein